MNSNSKLTDAQQKFLKNIVSPRVASYPNPRASKQILYETPEEKPKFQEFKDKGKINALNIIRGGAIDKYTEYLKDKSNKVCLFKQNPEFKQLYLNNENIKKYMDKLCKKNIDKLQSFNRKIDSWVEDNLEIDPTSPTSKDMFIIDLLQHGSAIYNSLNNNDQKEIMKFIDLDEADIDRIINKEESNLKNFIEYTKEKESKENQEKLNKRKEIAGKRRRMKKNFRLGGRKKSKKNKNKKSKNQKSKKSKKSKKNKSKKRYKK